MMLLWPLLINPEKTVKILSNIMSLYTMVCSYLMLFEDNGEAKFSLQNFMKLVDHAMGTSLIIFSHLYEVLRTTV